MSEINTDHITIPGSELTAAIKDINAVLEKADKIKVVGITNVKKIAMFTETILAIVAAGDEENIPDVAKRVYTEYIKNEMNFPAKKAAAAKKASTAKKPAAKKPAAKKPAPAKKPAAKKPAAKKPAAKKPAAAKKASTAKKPAVKKVQIERDEFGFSVNTKKHEFIVMISENPMKMAELKAETGDTYYNTVSAHADTILKTETGHFYVKGSPAEAIAKEIVKKAKADGIADKKAEAAKRANVKKTVTKKASPAKKAAAKKPAAKKPAPAKKPVTKRRVAKK